MRDSRLCPFPNLSASCTAGVDQQVSLSYGEWAGQEGDRLWGGTKAGLRFALSS